MWLARSSRFSLPISLCLCGSSALLQCPARSATRSRRIHNLSPARSAFSRSDGLVPLHCSSICTDASALDEEGCLPVSKPRRQLDQKRAIVPQRFPVLVAMWNQFGSASAHSDWFGSGLVQIGSERTELVICYEQL